MEWWWVVWMKQSQHENTNGSSLCQHNLHHASSNVQCRKYSLGKHSICRENIDNCDLGVGCSKHLVTNSENPNSWNIIWQHQKVRMWHNLIIDVTIYNHHQTRQPWGSPSAYRCPGRVDIVAVLSGGRGGLGGGPFLWLLANTLLMLCCRSLLVRFMTLLMLRCRSFLARFIKLLMLRCRRLQNYCETCEDARRRNKLTINGGVGVQSTKFIGVCS